MGTNTHVFIMSLKSILMLFLFFVSNINCEPSRSKNVLICEVCETIMTAIDGSIVDPTNEQDIADWLAQICNYVGPNLEAMCLEFVNEYTDDIIDQLVNNYLNPEQVCQAIGACP